MRVFVFFPSIIKQVSKKFKNKYLKRLAIQRNKRIIIDIGQTDNTPYKLKKRFKLRVDSYINN